MTNYGYEIHIWDTVYHNDKFSHSAQRRVVRHCPELILHPRPEQFSANVNLTLPTEIKVHDELVVKTRGEYIHSVVLLGKVKWVRAYERVER